MIYGDNVRLYSKDDILFILYRNIRFLHYHKWDNRGLNIKTIVSVLVKDINLIFYF